MSEEKETPIESVESIETPSYLPEAGGVAFMELWGTVTDSATERREAFKINVTARAETVQGAIDQIIAGMRYANEVYHLKPFNPLSPQTPNRPAPVTNQPNPNVTNSAAAPAPAPAPSQPVQENENQPEGGVIRVVKVLVTPRTDGKSKVEFFGAGRKYADLSSVMTPDSLANLFGAIGGWTPEHFMVATEYPVSFNAYWRNSDKMNSAGKPYRNVVRLEA